MSLEALIANVWSLLVASMDLHIRDQELGDVV